MFAKEKTVFSLYSGVGVTGEGLFTASTPPFTDLYMLHTINGL